MEDKLSWGVAEGTVDGVMATLIAALATRGWKDVTRQGRLAAARFGSRLALRFFGALMRPGQKRIPMRLVFAVNESADGVIVDAMVKSDEGWYLVRSASLERLYELAFADLLTALQSATTPAVTDASH
jgi:hypothetical protein